jgi:methylated-DNA-[protein]-cysteine S-methyltransferase
MNFFTEYSSPAGKLRIVEDGVGVTNVEFPSNRKNVIAEEKMTPLLKKTVEQLAEYFAGERKSFDLPLHLNGTAFQKQIWNELRRIPFGETRTYQQIAEAAGNPKAARAVGLANNRNPISIIIPCHRVIGANGALTGYAGGLETKKFLLDLEKIS